MKFKQEFNFTETQKELSISMSEIDKSQTELFIKINEKNERYIDLDTPLEDLPGLKDLTHSEAANFLCIAPRTLHGYRVRCNIPSYIKSGRRFYKAADLEKFFKNKKCFKNTDESDLN